MLRRPRRVLIVDDEENVRLVLGKIIQACGLDIAYAENGKQALEVFEQTKGGFELLVTDVCMPEMDGCDLVCEIRRRGYTLPIVVVTGFAESAQLDKIASCDVRILEKPLDFKALRSHVDLIVKAH